MQEPAVGQAAEKEDCVMGKQIARLVLGLVGGAAAAFVLGHHGFSVIETVGLVMGIGLLGGAAYQE